MLNNDYFRPTMGGVSDGKRGRRELLMDLARKGVSIGEQNKQILRSGGYHKAISEAEGEVLVPVENDRADERGHLWLTLDQAKRARERTDDPQKNATCYLDRIPSEWVSAWASKTITQADWKPLRPDRHTDEFRAFISSHIPRFDRINAFKPFYLYILQARRWIEEGTTVEDFSGTDQWQYAIDELNRIRENKLYGMDKYGWIKDDTQPGGWRKYFASTPQALIAYLRDCGYSGELLKGRQAAITSTVMLWNAMTMSSKPSFKGVLVSDDVDFTGKAIFNDKFRASWKMMFDKNPWMRPLRMLDAIKTVTFDWSEGDTKGERGLYTSNFSLGTASDPQSVNGNSPSIIDFDETQNIGEYFGLKEEIAPALIAEVGGSLKAARQFFAYGTGTSSTVGRGAFEGEIRNNLESWDKGTHSTPIIPLFFDWTCRPFITKSFYDEQYQQKVNVGESAEMHGKTKEERAKIFYSAYPSTPNDAFLNSHKTIIPVLNIRKQMDDIKEYCIRRGLAPKPGRFEPIYNMGVKMPEGCAFPYAVTGAKWKPVGESEDAPCYMLNDRAPLWAHRFFQGTDPIQNEGGLSKFASVIWDRVGWDEEPGEGGRNFYPTFACVLNDRTTFTDETFAQNILMGVYYANYGQKACMELVEWNQGQSYVKTKIMAGLEDSLLLRAALPPRYSGGSHPYGIDLKEQRKQHVFNDTVNLLRDHGHNIWYYDYWNQVQKIAVDGQPNGNVVWAVKNDRTDNDDMVFAGTYSWLCSDSIDNKPVRVDVDAPPTQKITTIQYVDQDTLEWDYVEQEVPMRL